VLFRKDESMKMAVPKKILKNFKMALKWIYPDKIDT
jgi:hypothetical protein